MLLSFFNIFKNIYNSFFHRINPMPKNVSLVNLLSDGSNNAFITDSEYLKFLEKSNKGSVPFTVLKEKVLTNHWGFMLFSNQFIFKAFNTKIPQLVESGIADYIIQKESQFRKNFENASKIPLSLEHLEHWFKFMLFSYALSGVIFILEFVCNLFENLRIKSGIKKRKFSGSKKVCSAEIIS